MKLSLKNMVVSFVVGIVLFSVVMAVICSAIFRDRVNEQLADGKGTVINALPERSTIYDFSECSVYYEEQSGVLTSAVLVCVSTEARTIILTPLDAKLPLHFRNGIYFVSSICAQEGVNALSDIASALTGMEVSKETNLIREDIASYLQTRYPDFTVQTNPVILDKDGIADTEKTVATFFKSN